MKIRQSDIDKEGIFSGLFLFISLINYSILVFFIVNSIQSNREFNSPLIIISLFFISILFSIFSIYKTIKYKRMDKEFQRQEKFDN